MKYDDLLADWRTTMQAASTDLGLGLDVPPATAPHEVDEFIDPQLSRHRLTWDDVDVLPELAEVAEQVWQACERLAAAHGTDPDAEAALDAAGARYAAMYRAAQLLAGDSTTAEANQARKAAKREARRAGRHGADNGGGSGATPGGRGADTPGMVARLRRRAGKPRR